MRGRKLLLLINFFLTVGGAVCGQERGCAVGSRTTVAIVQKTQLLQRAIEMAHTNPASNLRAEAAVINIPVVVHVVHSNVSRTIGGAGNANISDEQIFSQLKVLNNDFRRLRGTPGFNTNPVGADMEINFYLATKDADGLPFTGIVRVYHPQQQYDVFSEIELLSSLSYQDSNRFLNIWVTSLTENYIGYAEFPTADNVPGLDVPETNERTDGIVIDHTAFGNRTGTSNNGIYTYGRTLTHEIGHWLGLVHTWGDSFCGNDFVADTPTAEGPNNTTSCDAIFSRCDGVRSRNMIENYLDYTPDSCMNVFTEGQKARVRTVFEVSKRRNRLLKASVLNFEQVAVPTLSILSNPATLEVMKIQVLLPDFQDFELKVVNLNGQVIFSRNYVDFPGLVLPVSQLVKQPGVFFIRLSSGDRVITKKIAVY